MINLQQLQSFCLGYSEQLLISHGHRREILRISGTQQLLSPEPSSNPCHKKKKSKTSLVHFYPARSCWGEGWIQLISGLALRDTST